MAVTQVKPTGVERFLGTEDIIVSKTDPRGVITYANEVFLKIAGYTLSEILGQPHNIIRHPAMPRGVFKFLWDRLEEGHEVFAVVLNMAKNGDHYWVLAHVTPTFDEKGRIVSYHSNRRCPERPLIKAVEPIYAQMLEVERPISNTRDAACRSLEFLGSVLGKAGLSYDEFIFSN